MRIMSEVEVRSMKIAELRSLAAEMGIPEADAMRKPLLKDAIIARLKEASLADGDDSGKVESDEAAAKESDADQYSGMREMEEYGAGRASEAPPETEGSEASQEIGTELETAVDDADQRFEVQKTETPGKTQDFELQTTETYSDGQDAEVSEMGVASGEWDYGRCEVKPQSTEYGFEPQKAEAHGFQQRYESEETRDTARRFESRETEEYGAGHSFESLETEGRTVGHPYDMQDAGPQNTGHQTPQTDETAVQNTIHQNSEHQSTFRQTSEQWKTRQNSGTRSLERQGPQRQTTESWRQPRQNFDHQNSGTRYTDHRGFLSSSESGETKIFDKNASGFKNETGSKNDQRERTEKRQYSNEERPQVEGILDISEGGFGFLRFHNFLTSDKDIYVSPTQIRRFNLKTGDRIKGISRRPNEGERFGALLYVNTVNGDEPGVSMRRPNFEDLTPIFPYERIRLESGNRNLAMRLIDLIAPIGKGQRGLIVAPPKAGKTVLLKTIASTIEKQHPEMHVIVLLIDERPEEVTDMERSIIGDVIYSTFDEQPDHHVKVAEMVLAHAQRMAEHKKDVVILLDSITRLARAYNMIVPSSGKTLSGGLDPGALHWPKKFFGAARKLEEGGSITILATALIETGSRMDDVIFEEFKGTGNMEIHLDRKLSEKRIFPAINLNRSSTRREDLLLSPDEFEVMMKVRRALSNQGVQEVTESIIDNLAHTKNNEDFVQIIKRTNILD